MYSWARFESFIAAFIIYFVAASTVGNPPILFDMTEAQGRAHKFRTALEGASIASAIMLFLALCGAGSLPI